MEEEEELGIARGAQQVAKRRSQRRRARGQVGAFFSRPPWCVCAGWRAGVGVALGARVGARCAVRGCVGAVLCVHQASVRVRGSLVRAW